MAGVVGAVPLVFAVYGIEAFSHGRRQLLDAEVHYDQLMHDMVRGLLAEIREKRRKIFIFFFSGLHP